jgi:hypothetical protein
MNTPEYRKMPYLRLLFTIIRYLPLQDVLMRRVRQTLEDLYSLDIVKHFCQSKKPSRCMISLGYTALKVPFNCYIMLNRSMES